MNRWKQKLEMLAMAIAYSEAGDSDTAARFLEQPAHRVRKEKTQQQRRHQQRPRPRVYRS